MKESNLIDMFGLSGDPSCDERLDDLLFRLEFGDPEPTPCEFKIDLLALFHDDGPCSPESENVPLSVEKAEKGLRNHERGL